MRVILFLLLGISACFWIGRKVFGEGQSKLLQQVFYGLALVQAVILVYIMFLGLVQGGSLFA